MESNSAWPHISARLRGAFRKWRPLFALALLLTLAVRLLFFSERAVCLATVNFNYTGIESGYDPNGNLFEPTEMKNAEIVRRAAGAAGLNVTQEDVERLQGAIEIEGEISDSAFQTVTENTSIFGEDELSEVTDIRERSYFPSRYALKLHYADAGLSAQDATRFLTELLNAYHSVFYEKYGFQSAFQQSVDALDYQAYDYIDAVNVLDNCLLTLNSYLTRIEEQDNNRFVSKETGYSFPDLSDTLNTLRSENVQWVTSYIVSNNMTKDRDYLIAYYGYKIQDARRALNEQDSRLYTLNEQIDSYVKTNAVFPIMGESASGQGNEVAGQFEFTQPSQMYNSLINQKVDCQTAISETTEQISMLERRIERLRTEESSGNSAVVEEQLKSIDQKIRQLLSDIQRTSDEFYRTESLKDAFQILKEPAVKAISVGLKNTAVSVVAVEAMLVGLCILSAFRTSRASKERGTQ